MDFIGGFVSFLFSRLISDKISMRTSSFNKTMIQGCIGGGVAALAAFSA